MRKPRLDTGTVRHWAALVCLWVLLAFAWMETTHAHPANDLARGSNPCAVCIAVHANAPAVTAHPLPVVFATESVTIAFRAEHKGVASDISLFIRPPPAA